MIKVLIFFFIIGISFAQARAASVYLSPSSKSGNVGDTFSMDVKLDADDLYGYQLTLSWNKDIIELTSANPYPQNMWSDYFKLKDQITEGQYQLAYTAQVPSQSFTGTATLATLNFRVKGAGETTISFSSVNLGNSSGDAIPFTSSDGSFNGVGSGSTGKSGFTGNLITIGVVVIIILLVVVGISVFLTRKKQQ